MINLLSRLGLDLSPFKRGLAEAEIAGRKTAAGLARTFGPALKESISNLGAGSALAGAGAVAYFTKKLIDNASHTADLAEQYQLAVREVLALQAAAEDSGIQFERLGGAIDKLGNSRKDAATKNEALRKEFAKFGVTLQDLQNPALTNLALLKQMGSAMQGMEMTPAAREAFGELVGEKGQRLLEFIRAINESKPLVIVTEDQIRALDRMGDRFTAVFRLGNQLAQMRLGKAWSAGERASSGMEPGLGRGVVGTGAFLLDIIGSTAPTAFLLRTLMRRGESSGHVTPGGVDAPDLRSLKGEPSLTGNLFTPEAEKARSLAHARPLTFDGRTESGALGSAGLFFGGAGVAPVLREMQKQTGLLERVERAALKIDQSVREEI